MSEDAKKTVELDAQLLRTLAHPMRNRMLGLLRVHGPATATTLATRLGVNTGATSYHLRQLAEAGLVVEDDTRGNARDRWWKSAHQGTEFDKSQLLEEEPELALGFLHGVGQIYAENMFQAIDALQTQTPEWREATLISDYFFHLSAAETQQMLTEVLAVLEKYRTEDLTAPIPEGAKQVTVQIQAYPRETR
ncbi:helix-turn-helix domain-containing protein [Kribbella sp. NPDC006257]|uniref:ArsR/SmtB family transcription factor n=1 Tax=Kribbella sp. NPDC006257 TaxID=3156738 RepID=UPI0033B8480E